MYLYVVEARLQLVQVVSLYPKCRGKTYGRCTMPTRGVGARKLEDITMRSLEWIANVYLYARRLISTVHGDYVSKNNFFLILSLRGEINSRLQV